VYGPYVRKDRRSIVIMYDGFRRSARQLAKVRLEIKLGRRLVGDETVDHKDGDVTNDEYDNLKLLSSGENTAKSNPCVYEKGTCAGCGKEFVLSTAQRSSRSRKKRCFCSKECLYRTQRSMYVSDDTPQGRCD